MNRKAKKRRVQTPKARAPSPQLKIPVPRDEPQGSKAKRRGSEQEEGTAHEKKRGMKHGFRLDRRAQSRDAPNQEERSDIKKRQDEYIGVM